MRYWAYFAAKVVVAGLVLWGLLGLIGGLLPDVDFSAPEPQAQMTAPHVSRVIPIVPAPQILAEEPVVRPAPNAPTKKADPPIDSRLLPLRHVGTALAMNTALMVWFLVAAGTLFLIVRDQRYRCRVCLRRLRMPVETGSRGFMLQLGRPRTEYICPYGHGTLKEEDTPTSVLDGPEWTRHSDDIWAELCATGKEDSEKN